MTAASEAKTHSLERYVQALDEQGLLLGVAGQYLPKRPICQISYDSRQVGADCLFVCKGQHFQASYLQDALHAGAVAFVYEPELQDAIDAALSSFDFALPSLCKAADLANANGAFSPNFAFPSSPLASNLDSADANVVAEPAVCAIQVTDVRRVLPLLAWVFYGDLSRRLRIVGITGTKGKSTTAYYLRAILDSWSAAEGRAPAAYITSIDTFDGVERFESHITTPEVFELYAHLANALASGCEYLVMEVSSQGLKYGRVAGLTFAVGCFLNIAEDHISPLEHPSQADYLASKLRLFEQSRMAVVNADTQQAETVLAAALAARDSERLLTFSADSKRPASEAASVQAADIATRPNGLDFTLNRGERFSLGMTGMFNLENALAATACARALGVPESHIRFGLAQARVPGRMELLSEPGRPLVLVDYAHNRLSFERLFASLAASYPGRRYSIVFGCPGNKALGRRRELGELAGQFCAMAYLTEEDAGTEPVEEICAEIAEHVAAAGGRYQIIPDREQAIATALAEADAEDVVLLTGKGRESRQKRGSEYLPVRSDLEIATAILNKEELSEKSSA